MKTIKQMTTENLVAYIIGRKRGFKNGLILGIIVGTVVVTLVWIIFIFYYIDLINLKT